MKSHMKLLKENIEELIMKAQYIKRKEYEDQKLNDYLNYWIFFEENEKVIQRLTNDLIDVSKLTEYYNEIANQMD